MTPPTYFRICLVLPLLVPAAAWLLAPAYPAVVLVLAGLISGVPYVPFAIGIWIWLGRTSHTSNVPRVVLLAPLLFIPVESIALLGWKLYQDGLHWNVLYSLVLVPFISLFTVAFGYLYVGLACLPYDYLRRTGYVAAR